MLFKWSPLWRSPGQIEKLRKFLIESPMKQHVLECFETGFVSHFDYDPPEPWETVSNYQPLIDPVGTRKFRSAMEKEVREGRMIGGPGWRAKEVRTFFGGSKFYGIPSGAVEKNGDPYGRVIHDYGYHPSGSYSVNATHSCTSVKYKTITETAAIIKDVVWLIKADLATGFRQFGTHPADWRFQVYCNGPYEHYIDLACPYGKTNSPLEFCPPVALFADSSSVRYGEAFG